MASTRGYTGAKPGSTKGMTTLLARINLKGDFDPVLTLPSDGDTSYAGLVRHEGLLWVSYYSSHEGKSGIVYCPGQTVNGVRVLVGRPRPSAGRATRRERHRYVTPRSSSQHRPRFSAAAR
jgi:hypothetical protein